MDGSPKHLPTVIEKFYHWEKTTPNHVFLRQPKGDRWKELTYAQAGQEARKMVTALQKLGLQKGDHIAIYSKNCYHWILADLAIMMGGYVSVPLYSSLPKDQLIEVIGLGDIKAIFLGKLDSWEASGHTVPTGVKAIKFPHYSGSSRVTVGKDWDDLTNDSEPALENYKPNLDDLWTIKFTSGTTGTPKGVMHVHRTPALQMRNEDETNFLSRADLEHINMLSYLPLNHVGERMGVEVPVIWCGGTISFAESLDSFAKNLQEVQPNVFFAVPRIWNKFYLGVMAKMPPKKFNTLMKIPIISGIVKKKIRTALGMNKVKLAATGAAITPSFLKEFYRKLDIHLVESYGMTEICGTISQGVDPNCPQDSVGVVIPFGEAKIHPETGEILMKTPYMMKGYYKDPEKTAEVLKDGWMHSGDKGTIDEKGHIRVIGRVKDAFKTSKGSYVTPNPLEEAILVNDFIEQVCVVGLGIPQPLVMINLSEIGLAMDKNEVETSIRETIKQLNAQRANYERISTSVIHKETWTIANELVTPTLKIRRGLMDKKFANNYYQWHTSDSDVIWI